MELLNIQDVIKIRVSSDDVEKSKPAPDIYLKAAKLLSIFPENCLVIEDAYNGVKAAKSVGMKVVAYAGSPQNIHDLSQADLIVKSFREINTERLKSLFF